MLCSGLPCNFNTNGRSFALVIVIIQNQVRCRYSVLQHPRRMQLVEHMAYLLFLQKQTQAHAICYSSDTPDNSNRHRPFTKAQGCDVGQLYHQTTIEKNRKSEARRERTQGSVVIFVVGGLLLACIGGPRSYHLSASCMYQHNQANRCCSAQHWALFVCCQPSPS